MPSTNTDAQRRRGRPPARQAEIDRIEAELAPIDDEKLLDLLGSLMAGLPPRDGRDLGPGAIGQRIGAYLGILRRYSEATLREAYDQVMDGRAAELDARYLPTPPELARLCRKIDTPKRMAIGRLKDEIAQLAAREPSPGKRPEPAPPATERLPDGGGNSATAVAAAPFSGASDFARETRDAADREG